MFPLGGHKEIADGYIAENYTRPELFKDTIISSKFSKIISLKFRLRVVRKKKQGNEKYAECKRLIPS